MPKSDPSPACDDILVLEEKVAALESWRTCNEPEASTRTTAEAAGTPTFRGLEQTQTYFLDILTELALAVSRIYPAMSKLFDREGIDETELLSIV